MIFFQNLSVNLPIFSLFFSLILFVGLYQFGEIIFYNKNLNLIFSNISELKYQKILIAVNFLMIILFPIVLFFEYSREVLIFLSISIFTLGLFKIFNFLIKKNYILVNNISLPKYNKDYILFLLAIFGFFLITFSPVNHADSLNYHLGGAEFIFQTGSLPTALENFENLLIGTGEAFISLGVLFGAEQFGNLIQCSALLSLIGIIIKFNNNKYFLILLILTSPVLIFLASSPKPQLFHAVSNSIIFVILFINFDYFKNSKFFLTCLVILTNIFVINSINAKFSFNLSAIILYLILLIYCYKKKFLIQMVIINICFLSLFYFGFVYWKYINWGGNLFNYIINPFPIHLEGVQTFYEYLINYKREASMINLLIPKNFAQFTDPLGIGVLIFIYFFFQKSKYIIYFIPIFLFIIFINYFFGQPSSRFFFEVYLWMILLLASLKTLKLHSKAKIIFYFQFLLSIGAIWYGVFSMSFGFINSTLRDYVMTNTANGYSLFMWSNSVLNIEKDRVLSMHRSIYLGKTKTIASNFASWNRYNKSKIRPYHVKDLLSDHDGPTYLLTYGNKKNVGIFENCIDFLYLTKKNVGRHVGRNPFNKSQPYNGYLFKLKDLKKTECYKN